MMPIFLHFVLLMFSMYTSTSSLKILGISTLPSPSHHLWFTALMNGLAGNGHQIYAVSLQPTEFETEKSIENHTTSIVIEGMLENFEKAWGIDLHEFSQMNPIDAARFTYQSFNLICSKEIETQGAKRLLDLVRNTEIDLIVQDLTNGQCFYGLQEIALGNPPLVGFTPYGSPNFVKYVVGGNDWPAIKPCPIYHHMAPFTLWEKTSNFIFNEIDNFLRQYHYMPIQQEIAEKFIGKKMSKSLDEIERSASIMLINSYPALEPAIYLPPNAIEVGGLHIKDPKPLPEDIKTFLDAAEHGVVVVSMGTNVKTTALGPEKLKVIVAALGQLKQRVLWKFDDDHLENKPQNVMIKKWLPQGDVLAHPKVRVLWSHSGLLSIQESVSRGIPVIGMPFYLDQHANIDMLVKKGVGLHLDFESLTAKIILETFDRILNDPSFALRMKQLSEEYRDRPMSPMDLAVWHVEYAARHPQGPLASLGRDLSRVQLNLLDVYALLGVAVFSIFWIFWLLFGVLLNLFCRQRKTKTNQKLKCN